jgi:hypothetical protein
MTLGADARESSVVWEWLRPSLPLEADLRPREGVQGLRRRKRGYSDLSESLAPLIDE